MLHNPRLSRRDFLRAAAAGGAGLSAAYLIGCGDGDGSPDAATPVPTASGPTAPPPTQGPGVLEWTALQPAGALPPIRREHSLVSDGVSLFVFGGRDDSFLNDTWSYDVAANAWSEVTPAQSPEPRFGHNAVWHAPSARMVLFGGQGSGGAFFNDVWSYDPAANTWTQIDSGTGPSPRYGAAGTLDLQSDLVISHGFTDQGRFDDTWRFDLTANTWTEITPAGTRPVERCLMRSAWSELRDHMLMFGGQTTGTAFLGDLWALSSDRGWTPVEREPAPVARNLYAMVFDTANRKVVLLGGDTADGPRNDIWWYDAQDEFWEERFASGIAPVQRLGHDAAWVASLSSIFLFGGSDRQVNLNDLWQLGPQAS